MLTNVTNPLSQINRHSLYERTLIRRGATIGANATIVYRITLGRYCFIAAGAVVTKNTPDYALIQGVPGDHAGRMSRHGHLMKPNATGEMQCPESGYHYPEIEQPVLRALNWDEEAPLPPDQDTGRLYYDDFKRRGE